MREKSLKKELDSMIPAGPFQLGIFWDCVTWKERDKGAVWLLRL